jgi:hypothetical protein
MLAQRFIAVMNDLAGLAHRHGFDVPISIPVHHASVICERAVAAHLSDKPSETADEPTLTTA